MPIYRFDVFELDTERAWLGVQGTELRLRAKAHHVLVALLETSPAVQSTEQLLDKVWGTRHLTRNTVAQTLQEVRQTLKPWQSQEIIENLPRRGYRLTVPVLRLDASLPAGTEPLPAPELHPLRPTVDASDSILPAIAVAPVRHLRPERRWWVSWRAWAVWLAVALLIAVSLDGWFASAQRSRLPSVANLGIRISGRGGEAVESALASLISSMMVRDYGLSPILLGPHRGESNGETRNQARRQAHAAAVDLWFDGALTLAPDGRNVSGQIWFGGGRDTSIQVLMIQQQALDDLPALAKRLSTELGRAAVWPKNLASKASALSDIDMSRLAAAQVLIAQGRPASAVNRIAELPEASQTLPEVRAAMARAYLLQGRKAEVLKILTPEVSELELRYLRAMAEGDPAQAVRHAEARIQQEPPSVTLQKDLIEARLEAQQTEVALRELDQLQQQAMSDWDRAEFSVLRARVLNARGYYRDARALLGPVMATLAQVGDSELMLRARYQTAVAIGMLGDSEAALTAYQRLLGDARRLDVPRLEVRSVFGAADLLKANGELDAAEALLQDAVQRFPEEDFRDLMPQLYLGLAYVDMERGNWQSADVRAVAAQEILNQYAPQDAAAWSLRAEVALLQGDLAQSRHWLQQAFALDQAAGAEVSMARDAQRMAFRDLLVGDWQEARGQLAIADQHCRAAAQAQACQPAIEVLAKVFDPSRPDLQSLVAKLSQQRRGLRELSQVLLALFWQGRDAEVAAVLDRAMNGFEQAPRQLQEPFRLIALRIQSELKVPVPDPWRMASTVHPDMLPAWQALLAEPGDREAVCADPAMLGAWHALVCRARTDLTTP